MKKIPVMCPACTHKLNVEKLSCNSCSTSIQGSFAIPFFLQLSPDEQSFILQFLKASGSLKEMAKQLGHSYPKVRNMLDEIILKVGEIENQAKTDNDNK